MLREMHKQLVCKFLYINIFLKDLLFRVRRNLAKFFPTHSRPCDFHFSILICLIQPVTHDDPRHLRKQPLDLFFYFLHSKPLFPIYGFIISDHSTCFNCIFL